MKAQFLIAGAVLSVASLVVLCLTSFVPDFVVAIYNGADDKTCQVANVGAFTSDWSPECSREIDPAGKGQSGVAFSSPTTEFWPLFPLMNPESEGNPVKGLVGDFENCEKSLDQLDDAVIKKVSALVPLTAEAVGLPEDAVEGALWSGLSPLQSNVTSTVAGGLLGFQAEIYTIIFGSKLNYDFKGPLTAAQEAQLGNAEFVAGVIAATKEQLAGVYRVTAPCFCAVETTDELLVASAGGLLALAGAAPQNLPQPFKGLFALGVLDDVLASADGTLTHIVNACSAAAVASHAALIPEGTLVQETALDTCFERVALVSVAPGQYQSVFNAVESLTRAEALKECENDILDIEALDKSQTLLTVAVVFSGITILLGLGAVAMQSVTPVAVGALLFSIISAVITLVALLTIRGAPVYESVGAEGCVTCYEGSSGTTMGYASVALPIVAAICYGISLVSSAEEEEQEELVASM